MSNKINLSEQFAEFKESKNIDRTNMMRIMEEVFRAAIIKKYYTDENIDITVNVDKGDLEIWRNRKIVADDDLDLENLEIPYSEAIKIDPDFQIGEDVTEPVILADFGRRAVLALRQNLKGRIDDLENEGIFKKYKDRESEIITGEVYQVWKKETLVLDDEGNEMILPKVEQIPSDFFKKGDTVRAVIETVEMRNNKPAIVLSRTSPKFLERLFEQEVPEVFDGLIPSKKLTVYREKEQK